MRIPLTAVSGFFALLLLSDPAEAQEQGADSSECCIVDLVGIVESQARSGEQAFHGNGPAGGLMFSARGRRVGVVVEATRGAAFTQQVTLCTRLAERCFNGRMRERNWTASIAAVWQFADADVPESRLNLMLGVGVIARDQDGLASPDPDIQSWSPQVQWINSIVGGAGFDVVPTERLVFRVEYRMAFRVDAAIQHLRAGVGVRFDRRRRT